MRVSVLIVTYNRAAYICDAIESVLTQIYRDFEIVVVDDGSTDKTEQLVSRYPAVRYIYQPHTGIPCARNRALAEARGELIAWLDSDDRYAPEKLERQVAWLDTHPECQIIFCRIHCFSAIPRQKMSVRQKTISDVTNRSKIEMASACMYKELYERYGTYDEKYIYSEDTEFYIRLKVCGIDTSQCIDAPLYYRRIHDTNISYHDPISGDQYLGIYSNAIRNAKKRGL